MTHHEIDPADQARRDLEAALYECKRVVVGQDAMLERLLVALLTGGHVLLEGVPGLAKTLTVRTLATVLGGTFSRIQFHARPRAGRPRRHAHLAARRRHVPHRARPGVREPAARRRDQPRAREGAVRAARGHAGAPGHHRRSGAPRARAVPRARHAEPDRVGGHLRPPGGAGRPLPVQARRRLPGGRGRDRGRRPRLGRPAPRAPRGGDRRPARAPAGRPRCVRRPLHQGVRGVAGRPPPPPRPLRPRGPRAADPVRRQPARVARARAGRAGAGAPARPHPRHPPRRARPRPRRAPPPARALLRRARRPGSAGRPHRPAARHGRAGGERATRGGGVTLVDPPGRQGPGPLAGEAIARLDLGIARRAGGPLPGERRAPGVGTGTELAQLRPYEPGDDPRQLDPAASARTGVPHVRQHVPERALTTWIVLDLSASMAFGTGLRLKSDVAEGVASTVAQLAVRRGGRVAVVTTGAPATATLPPRSGRRAFAAVRRLVGAGVAPDRSEPALALPAALERVGRLARTRGLVVVVSDFRDEAWAAPLRALAQRHAVTAIAIGDPREAELRDAGQLVLMDPETGATVEADTASPRVRAAFAAAEAERRAAVADAIRRARAHHVTLQTDSDWLRELARVLR